MCTVLDLVPRVARAQLPYAESLVCGVLVGACEGVCARAVPAWGVPKCDVGARWESGQRLGCGESVPGSAGVRRALVGSPLQRRGRVGEVCGRTHGGLVDEVSSLGAGSGMHGHLCWFCVRWLFQGCCAGRRLGNGTAIAWGAGTLRKGS